MKLHNTFYLLLFCLITRLHAQATTPQATPPMVHQLNILSPEPVENVIGKDKLKLECTVSGNPLPVIEWSFNGKRFIKDKPFSGVEGDPVNHVIEGNRLTINGVRGKTQGDPNYYNSGEYRCIATNEVGSVFLEKNFNIKVMGYFKANARVDDDTQKVYVTIGRKHLIPCPPHVIGYGTTYSWGKLTETGTSTVVERYEPGQINDHLFYTTNGQLVYAVVTEGDVKESQDIGGLRCILSNDDEDQFSRQVLLWKVDVTKTEERFKPTLVARLPDQMNAELNTAYTMTCGATGLPVPKISWEYQGFPVKPRFPGSRELNFEFFQIIGNGMQLKIQRITEYSGGTFKCYAENQAGLVWSIGQLRVTFPPKFTKVFPEVIDLTLETKLSLLCNATGNPRPDFRWYQNSTDLVTDTRKKVNGSSKIGVSLTIETATFDDNGIYICVAHNNLDTITQSVFIKVESMKPKFEVPIDNPIYLFRTETMYIPCNPKGGPIPVKTWKKDGKTIETGGRYVVHKNGTLEIKQVQDEDKGIYECTATNSIGKDSSSGTAVVLDPVIITNPPENQTHEVGWPFVQFFCGASWDPRLDLRIEWYKGGVRMTKFTPGKIWLEDRAMGPPRILYIYNMTIDDTGLYSCHAYTKVGNVISQQWAAAALEIKGPPEPPAGVRVTGDCYFYNPAQKPILEWSRGEELNVETIRFYIEFSTNISQSYGDWYGGEGHPEIPGSRLIAEPGTRVKFTLEKNMLVPGANLIFRIRAASDFLTGRPSRPSFPNECITAPGKPVINPLNVSSYALGPGSLIIKWRPITNVYQGAAGFYYEVGYRLVGTNAYTTKEIRDLNVTELEVTKTEVFKQFNFYVRSHNELGPGPEPTVKTNYSGNERPKSAPNNLRVKFITQFAVELMWDHVETATGYRVTYWNITDAERLRGRNKRAITDPIVKMSQTFIGDQYKNGASLSNLTAQLDFLASVAALNSGGFGPESPLIQFRTETRVPGKPSNVHFQVYGRSAHISWNPPIHPNGYIEQYEISWYESSQQSTDDSRSVATQRRMSMDRRSREAYMVKVFQPLRYYTVRLLARNRVGPGRNWEQALVAVSAPDMPGKPGAPKAVPFDDSAINVTFQRPTYGGLPSKFLVYYRPTGEFFTSPKVVEQAFPLRAWILVKGLDFLVYDFWTVGVNELGQSETSDVTEEQPIRRPKPQAHASDFEWYRSNWFVAIMICILFVVITTIVVIILLKSGPQTYKRLKDSQYGNGFDSYNRGATQMKPMETKVPVGYGVGAGAGAAVGATAAYDARNQSASEAPSDQQDLPPRYSSQSSLEKKRYSDESSEGSRSRSGSDYSGSETESGSETGSDYSDESDGSYYSDDEKKRDSESEGEENEEDLSTFV